MTRLGHFISNRFGLVTTQDAGRLEISSSTLATGARSGRLDHPHRGVYRAVGVDDEHQVVRAAAAHLGPEASIVIGSAAIVAGLQGLPRGWRPQLALPPGLERPQRRAMELHFWDLPPSHLTTVDDLRVTTVVRTVADVCRLLPKEQSVALVDSALHLGLLSPDDFQAVVDLMARRRNCVAGRRHLGLARIGAESPGETRLRLVLQEAGMPPDALQAELRDDDGHLIGYGDLGYALRDGRWLIVEFDGRAVHELPEAVLHDRRRQNAIVARRASSVLRFTWDDLRVPRAIVASVRAVLAGEGWSPGLYRPRS